MVMTNTTRTASPRTIARRYPVGAELQGNGVHFRVWAPRRRSVSVVVDERELAMEREEEGYFSLRVEGVGSGSRYGFRLDGSAKALPDPASRFQPDGPHGLSAVVDPAAYRWSDAEWLGRDAATAVIYELHIGTFTTEGTWNAAEGKLEHLVDAGINMLEVMPVAEFAGSFGWGYDGVDLWAPSHLYGTPDDVRHFIDTAHRLGLAVILDVVYNHGGPDGNYLREFADQYFTDRYENEWGESINYDGEGSDAVRDFFSFNAAYWIDEFHFDGLRLDATQSMFDASREHVLMLITKRARAAAGERTIYLVAENEPQDVRTVRSVEEGGHGLDAMWNDDFHHAARVALTGVTDAYYSDYRGAPQELVSIAKHGFLYQGQRYQWQKQNRGTPSFGLRGSTFVVYLQNHDQIANAAYGERLSKLTDPASLRAMTALTLLGPATPMIFQGDEFGATTPFMFFADHRPELAKLVAKGRSEFLAQFPPLATPEMQQRLPRPDDPAVFAACRLDWTARNEQTLALHRDLLFIRRSDAPFSARHDGRESPSIDGAVLSERAFVLRAFYPNGNDRLLIVNLGSQLRPQPVSEPLLAAPADRAWHVQWSSEAAAYGGHGMIDVLRDGVWTIPARCCLLLGAGAEEKE